MNVLILGAGGMVGFVLRNAVRHGAPKPRLESPDIRAPSGSCRDA